MDTTNATTDVDRLIEAQRANPHAYTDRYPSGKTYVACGFPHPTRSDEGRCSKPEHTSDFFNHMNRDGNSWTGVGQCLNCGHKHEGRCNGIVSNGWNSHGCHCEQGI